MAPKTKQSLALSRRKIAAERVNLDLRRTVRIEQLYADAGRSSELVLLLCSYHIVHDPALLLLAIP